MFFLVSLAFFFCFFVLNLEKPKKTYEIFVFLTSNFISQAQKAKLFLVFFGFWDPGS